MPQTRQHIQGERPMHQHRRTETGVLLTQESIEQFLEACQSRGRVEGTLQWYRRGLNRLYQALPEDKFIRQGVLERWREELVEMEYTPGTVNMFLSIANSYLDFVGHRECQLASQLKPKSSLQPELTRDADDTRILGLAFESMVIGEKQVTDKESEILSRNYSVGDKIVFTEESNGTRYFSSGVSYIETDSAWSSGKAGQIILAMGDFSGALMGEFELKDIYAGPQKLIVRSNGQILYDAEITSVEEPVKFTIPEGCVKNGQLVLDLEYPNAVSPASRHESTDNRELALRFSSIYFYEDR